MEWIRENLTEALILAVVLGFMSAAGCRGWYKNKGRLFFQMLMTVYLCGVVYFTMSGYDELFKFGTYGNTDAASSIINAISYISIVPFEFGGLMNTDILNVIMAIPFGILWPFLTKYSIKKVFIYSLSFGGVIEIIQLALNAFFGVNERVVDINDIICNFAGSVIGFIAFVTATRIFRFVCRNRRLGGILEHWYKMGER